MGIDRIGKGGSTPPSTERAASGGAESAPGTGKAFEVRPQGPAGPSGPAAADPAQPAQSAPTGALERLRAGQTDLNGYLDQKVSEATSHLQGMRASEIDEIRSILRDELASDPALVELVQQATGQAPTLKD